MDDTLSVDQLKWALPAVNGASRRSSADQVQKRHVAAAANVVLSADVEPAADVAALCLAGSFRCFPNMLLSQLRPSTRCTRFWDKWTSWCAPNSEILPRTVCRCMDCEYGRCCPVAPPRKTLCRYSAKVREAAVAPGIMSCTGNSPQSTLRRRAAQIPLLIHAAGVAHRAGQQPAGGGARLPGRARQGAHPRGLCPRRRLRCATAPPASPTTIVQRVSLLTILAAGNS